MFSLVSKLLSQNDVIDWSFFDLSIWLESHITSPSSSIIFDYMTIVFDLYINFDS